MHIKKTTILYMLTVGCFCLIIISGFKSGPAANFYDCTGAETGNGNAAGCSSAGSSCHSTSATAGINLLIELDSAGGVPTTHYTAGLSYTVKITGTNNTSNTLSRYGFQVGSIVGSAAQPVPTNAGSWPSPYPASTHFVGVATWTKVALVEHVAPLSPSTGSGGNGTKYIQTIKWTAPASGTGTVSIWAALNAVNNNTNADFGDLWNTNHIVIDEWTVNSTTGIVSPESRTCGIEVNVFPNPARDYAKLNYSLTENADVKADLFDLEGKKVCNLFSENQSTGQQEAILDISQMNLKSGMYFIILNADGKVSSRKLVVQ